MTDTRWIHLLGAGPWQLESIRCAKALGLKVLVTDWYAERPGYALADAHEAVDLLDVEATLACAQRYRVGGIVCDTTDTGVRTAAAVAERLGLAGIGSRAALACTDKSVLRQRLAAAHRPTLGSARIAVDEDVASATTSLGWPLVVKPVDNQSGRGVGIARDDRELADAVAAARANSRSGVVLVEAYREGREFIVDGFVLTDRVEILGIAVKTPSAQNATISRRIVYLGGNEFDAAATRLRAAACSLVQAVELRSGIFHAEFIDDGVQAVPIDLAARGGGVMIYPIVLPHVSGIDVMSAVMRVAMGGRVELAPLERRRAACVDFPELPCGVVEGVEGVESARAVPGVAIVHLAVAPGSVTVPWRQKDDRPGFVVALADDADEAARRAALALDALQIRVRPAEQDKDPR